MRHTLLVTSNHGVRLLPLSVNVSTSVQFSCARAILGEVAMDESKTLPIAASVTITVNIRHIRRNVGIAIPPLRLQYVDVSTLSHPTRSS